MPTEVAESHIPEVVDIPILTKKPFAKMHERTPTVEQLNQSLANLDFKSEAYKQAHVWTFYSQQPAAMQKPINYNLNDDLKEEIGLQHRKIGSVVDDLQSRIIRHKRIIKSHGPQDLEKVNIMDDRWTIFEKKMYKDSRSLANDFR